MKVPLALGFMACIYGEPASKANSRRIVRMGGRMASIKSQKALDYSDSFRKQVPVMEELIKGDLRIDMDIYYASRRPDLDESLILDLLQDRVYVNDRQVKERHTFWNLDKHNPRALIRIYRMDKASNPFKDI